MGLTDSRLMMVSVNSILFRMNGSFCFALTNITEKDPQFQAITYTQVVDLGESLLNKHEKSLGNSEAC